MIAIISDIHGNYPALTSALEEIDRLGITEVISLGDIAGYYPMINECIDELRRRNIVNLMGNHDDYLCSNVEITRSKSASELLEYQRKVISKDNLEWLSQSTEFYNKGDVSMVHGGWNHPTEEYLYNISDRYFEDLKFKYFFCGHSHVQKLIKMKSGKNFCNPGSIGQPRDGDPRAAFAVLKTGKVELKRIEYDIDRIANAMKSLGFPGSYFQNLYEGKRIGGKIDDIHYA
jgi:predicted phosphodiesterase